MYVYIYVCVCVCVRARVYMYVCMYVCMCVCVCIYIYIYISSFFVNPELSGCHHQGAERGRPRANRGQLDEIEQLAQSSVTAPSLGHTSLVRLVSSH